MTLKNFAEAEEYLDQFIPQEKKTLFTGGFGLARAKHFLQLLGNPQNNIKSIHVAGTSGKGSTAYLTSILLKSHGFSTGLFMSPHIISVCERIQIDNEFISETQFTKWVNYFIPFIEIMKKSEFGQPSWFEIITALAFCEFYTKKVDYAVIETGLGGLYDSTNTIEKTMKLVLLTKIGFDHTQILGNTLGKIAKQKAGIIHAQNTVISIYQKATAKKVIEQTAKKQNAQLKCIEKNEISNIQLENNKTIFDLKTYNLQLTTIELSLIGEYQAENASLAIAAIKFLSDRDKFTFDEKLVRSALKSAYFIGRFEVKKVNGDTLIIDGAHNPQKMKSFITSLKKMYPKQKFTFLLSFKKGKDYKEMLETIIPIAKKIILTEFISNQEFAPIAERSKKLAAILEKLNFTDYEIIPDIKKALEESLRNGEITIATGSLYFISHLYKIIKKY